MPQLAFAYRLLANKLKKDETYIKNMASEKR